MICRSRRVKLVCAAFAICDLYNLSVSLITRRGLDVNPGRVDQAGQADASPGGDEVGAIVHV